MKKEYILIPLTIIISFVLGYIIGSDFGWSSAYRELTDSSACRMTKRNYHKQIG
jgi:hypothetical protein